MTEIDFYVLASQEPGQRERLACRIAEKAWLLGHEVFVHAADDAGARRLDELLWTFRDGSFVPHALAANGGPAPVRIGAGREPEAPAHLLINLDPNVPPFFSRFERVAEIVSEEAVVREAGRERFRFYRDRGYSLRTHKL